MPQVINDKRNQRNRTAYKGEILIGNLSDRQIRHLIFGSLLIAAVFATIFFFNEGESVGISRAFETVLSGVAFGVGISLGWKFHGYLRGKWASENLSSVGYFFFVVLELVGVLHPRIGVISTPFAMILIGVFFAADFRNKTDSQAGSA